MTYRQSCINGSILYTVPITAMTWHAVTSTYNTSVDSSASEVTTLWRYTNLFIIITIITITILVTFGSDIVSVR